MDPRLARILDQLRAGKFAELRGARVSATLPLSERLLNELVAAVLPASAPVRDLSVRPLPGNRVSVRGRLGRAAFLPPFTITLEIERQPQFPDSPLVLRVMALPGLLALAGSAVTAAAALPPGIRLDKDRVLVDLRALLERAGYGDVAPLIEQVRVTAEDGRLLLHLELKA